MRKSVLVISNIPNGGEIVRRLANGGNGNVQISLCTLSQLPQMTRNGSQPDALLIDETAIPSTLALKQTTAYLRKTWPETRTFVVGEANLEQMLAAARGDADGFVPKTSSAEEIAAMIVRAALGEDFVLPQDLLKDGEPSCSLPYIHETYLSSGGLTPREREIITLIAEGLTNRELSAKLHISIETAKWHVKNALRKLGLRDRTELAIHWHSMMGAPVEITSQSMVTCW